MAKRMELYQYPFQKSLSIFTKAKKRMVILKNGDHSLSQTKNLNKILSELKRFSKQIS